MDYLNLGELARLCSRFQGGEMAAVLREGQKPEGVDLAAESEEGSLLGLGRKVNEREIWKLAGSKEKKARSSGPERWMFGEFKIFVAAALLHARASAKALPQLDEADSASIQRIFPRKSLQFVHYELASLTLSQQKSHKPWGREEEAILKAIVTRTGPEVEWRTVCVQLFAESRGAFFRAQKDCRERWRNYLDPKVSKCEWSEEEDEKLMRLVKVHGPRWSLIAKKFHGRRTEHMVKNRYNSFFRLWKVRRGGKARSRPSQLRGGETSTGNDVLDQLGEDGFLEFSSEEPELQEKVKEQPMAASESEAKEAASDREELEGVLDSQFIERRAIQTSKDCDKLLKRTNDRQELSCGPDARLLSWQSEANGFSGIFCMQPQAKQAAMSEVVAALGCSHFEAMLESYEPEGGNFEWLSE